MQKKKGQVWISMVIYILIAIAAVTIILEVVVPLIEQMGDKSSVSKAQDTMFTINDYIKEVASGAVGSQRQVPIYLQTGDLGVDDGKLRWEYYSEYKLTEPYARNQLGNVILCSNCDVIAYSENNSYIINNTYKITYAGGDLRLPVKLTANKVLENYEFEEIRAEILDENEMPITGLGTFRIEKGLWAVADDNAKVDELLKKGTGKVAVQLIYSSWGAAGIKEALKLHKPIITHFKY